MPIAYAVRILVLAFVATPIALLIPWGAIVLWGIALIAAGLLAAVDFLDLLEHGL